MPFTSIRNGTPNPVTLPAPYGGILSQGTGIVIPDSFANVMLALGSPVGSGLDIQALPDNYSGPTGSVYFISPVTKERLGVFTRENIAAALTDSALTTATDGAATFTSQLAERDGSIVGLWLILSGAAAGDTITVSASIAGTAVAGTATVIAIAGTQTYATFNRGLYTFTAGQALGMMITTPAGWTATTVDCIGGLIIEA